MPFASGPPSAATSSSLIRPSRTWIALTYASEFSLSESPNRTISGIDNAKLESTCPRSPVIWSRFLIPSIYLARIGGLAARSTAQWLADRIIDGGDFPVLDNRADRKRNLTPVEREFERNGG